jgi:hypothetical protein
LGEEEGPTSRRHEKKEEQLYAAIARDLMRRFQNFGSCAIHVTHERMPRDIKERLEKDTLYYLRIEKLVPDLMGYFEPTDGTKLPPRIKSGLIIAEVKSGLPRIRHIYQAKMYAEAFNCQNTFLISDTDMSVEMAQFLHDHSHILFTSVGYSRLTVGTYHPGLQALPPDFYWYPDDPFAVG